MNQTTQQRPELASSLSRHAREGSVSWQREGSQSLRAFMLAAIIVDETLIWVHIRRYLWARCSRTLRLMYEKRTYKGPAEKARLQRKYHMRRRVLCGRE
jgi:hypothetical protein